MSGDGCRARFSVKLDRTQLFLLPGRVDVVVDATKHRSDRLRRRLESKIAVGGVVRESRDLKSGRALCEDRLTLSDQPRYPQLHIVDLHSLADVLVAAGAAVQVTERGPQVVRHIFPGLPSVPPDSPFLQSRCRQPMPSGHIGAVMSSARAAQVRTCRLERRLQSDFISVG